MQARRTEAETFRAALSGKTDAGGGWLRVRLERPGVLLLRRLGPGGPREWRSPCSGSHSFGHAHLPMSEHALDRRPRPCRCGSVSG